MGCLRTLARLRHQSPKPVCAWATIDAGPHVVALCRPDDAPLVAEALRLVPGVVATLICMPAGAAHVLEVEPGTAGAQAGVSASTAAP